jgi:precorrin-6x reductase
LAEVVLFGGTREGREITASLRRKGISTLVCVATGYGGTVAESQGALRVNIGRLNRAEMKRLLRIENPRAVIDATHPYAASVSENIIAACENTDIRLLRVVRESYNADGCMTFSGVNLLADWLNVQRGVAFSTLGTKDISVFTRVENFRDRIYLRILPDINSLSACINMNFPQNHIICMQGPFSKELNAAMFRETKSRILLTKESGRAGGFPEKVIAAKECGMVIAVLMRPICEHGVTPEKLSALIENGEL